MSLARPAAAATAPSGPTEEDLTTLARSPLLVFLLVAAADGKVALVAGVSGTALGPVKAGELLAHVAGQIGGKGGGRPDMAQGGGEDGPNLRGALEGVQDWVKGRLACST